MSHLSPEHLLLEWERLRTLAGNYFGLPVDFGTGLILNFSGDSITTADGVLVRGTNLYMQDGRDLGVDKALVRLTHSDWDLLKAAGGCVRVLFAAGFSGPKDIRLLDCTGPQSILVAHAKVQVDTTVRIAEIFAGGSWDGARLALPHSHCPIEVAWSLEVDAQCEPSQACIHPHSRVVSSPATLCQAAEASQFPIRIRADAHHSWWHAAFLASPISVVTLSAPCQPWSSAGRESGLTSQDGRLLVHLARVCGSRAVPVVVIEQVSGFPHHGHFHQVLSEWSQAGYRVVCRGSVNLHDILPTSRLRFLLVLAHHSLPDDDGLAQFVWPERLSTSLGQAHAVFDIPPEMYSAFLLDSRLLQVYLDPVLMPGKFQQHPRAAPAKQRVVTESQMASCFMAQYGYAHELPRDLLEAKGLHGSLLQQGSTTRFFSAPEMASAMGALSPIWCPHDRRLSHRILGNCISVPHAILGLHRACQALGIDNLPGSGRVLQLALGLRLHNLNSVFIPLQEGWILCHKRDVPVIVENLGQHWPFELPAGQDVSVDTLFGQAVLRKDDSECRLHLPQPLLTSGALKLIGYPPQAAAEWMRDCVDVFAVAVEELPVLGPRGIQGPMPSPETITVLAGSEVFVASRGSPLLWAQIQAIGQHVTAGSAAELVLLDVHGQVLDEASQLPRCCVATCTHGDCHFLSLALLAAAVPHIEVRPSRVGSSEGWLLSVRPEVAGDCWLGFPFSVVSGIG